MLMNIRTQGLPYAGEDFWFVVEGGTGKTVIEAYIDDRMLLRVECPDPPCHEMMKIPEDTGGSVFRLMAEDSAGHRIEKSFKIGGVETGAGGTAGRTLRKAR
jgi:hypothetical protein